MSREELEEYLQEDFHFNLLEIKKISKGLLNKNIYIVIDTICEYKIFEFLYYFNIDFSIFERHCDKSFIEQKIKTNLDQFQIELLFYYLKDNNYEFSQELMFFIQEYDYNNTITNIIKKEEKLDILNMSKVIKEFNKVNDNSNKLEDMKK